MGIGRWALVRRQRRKATFTISQVLYQFEVLPFTPSTFEKLVERVLQGLIWQMLLVFLADVITFSCSIPEELEKLGAVFSKLVEAD